MLIQRTLLYLPAQLLGPLAQFIAAVVWTHYMGAAEYGLFALAIAGQELADAVCMFWWSQSMLRHVGDARTAEQRARYAATERLMLSGLLVAHACVALATVAVTDAHMTGLLAFAIIANALTKALTSYLAERARAIGKIGVYTLCNLSAPTLGLACAWLAVEFWREGAEAALLGYALAQAVTVTIALFALGVKPVRAKPSREIVMRAVRYGLPLVAASLASWAAINGARLVVEMRGSIADVGLLSVGWGLGLRLASVVSMMFAAAAFPLALERMRAGQKDEAMADLALNGAMLFGLLAPMTVGLFFISEPLVELLVAKEYQAVTIAVLPLAALAGASRNWRVHFIDHVYLLRERTSVLTMICALEGVLVIAGCAVGYSLAGVPGAVAGALVGVLVALGVSVALAVTRFDLRLPLADMAKASLATMVMAFMLWIEPFAWMTPALRIAAEVGLGALTFALAMLLLHRSLRGVVLRQLMRLRPLRARSAPVSRVEDQDMSARSEPLALSSRPPAPIAHVGGQAINVANLEEATRLAADSAERGRGFSLFTLNLDHIVKLKADERFRKAYAAATFVTADGAPIVWLGRREAPALTRATGADLVLPLCAEAARRGIPVHFFGASPQTLAKAAAILERRCPGLVVAGMEAPRMGFDPRSEAADAAGDAIAASGARLCFVALGAPKQEFFAERVAARHGHIGFVCIGAALDFIAGEKARAPAFMQKTGLEWAWRLMSEPRRMTGRYASCAIALAGLILTRG